MILKHTGKRSPADKLNAPPKVHAGFAETSGRKAQHDTAKFVGGAVTKQRLQTRYVILRYILTFDQGQKQFLVMFALQLERAKQLYKNIGCQYQKQLLIMNAKRMVDRKHL